jgi:hypothetical protein
MAMLPRARIISDLTECQRDELLSGVYLQVGERDGDPRGQLDGLVAIRSGPFAGAILRVQAVPDEAVTEGEKDAVAHERPPRLMLCSPDPGAEYLMHPCVERETGIIRGLSQALQGVPWRMALVGRFIKKIFVEPTFAFELFESMEESGNVEAWEMLLNDPATFAERARAASLASFDAAIAYTGHTSLTLRQSNPDAVADLMQHAKKLAAPTTSTKDAAVAWLKGLTARLIT